MPGLSGRWGAHTRPRPPANLGPVSGFFMVHAAGHWRSLVGSVQEKMSKNKIEFYNIFKLDLNIDL